LLYAEDEVEALGNWFGLPSGAALSLMSRRVEHTNLHLTLNPETFQKPEEVYRHVLDRLASARAPYVALEGPPGGGKTTLAQHLGLNPLLGSWYDVVLYAPAHHQAGWRAGDEAAILEALNEFLWTLDPGRSPAATPASAHSALRRLLHGRRALFILDDVADVGVLPQLFVRGMANGLLTVVASGTALDDADLHLHRVHLPGWSHEQARSYAAAALSRELSSEEARAVDALNEWGQGLPLLWAALAELLAFEDHWSGLVEELQVEGQRIHAVLTRLLVRLPPAEARLLETWGVFAPHASLDPPAMACVADVGADEARRGLHALTRRHLVRFDRGRFELHPILGHFARQQLAHGDRLAICAERHARFYAERARPLRDEQNSPGWIPAVQRLLPDLPNVRLGQTWAAEQAHPLVVDYFLNLAPYLVAVRDLESDRAWGQAALPVVEANPQSLSALDRLTFYAEVSASEPEQQRAHLERALAIIREEMSDEPTAYRIYGLCWLARFLYDEAGKAMEAEPILAEAFTLAAESGYPDLETHVLGEAARFFLLLRDRAGLQAAADRLPVEPPAMHAAGLSGNYYHTLRAETLRQVGRWREAEGAYSQVLDLYEAIEDRRHGAVFRLRRALCRARLGDAQRVEADLAWVRKRLAELPWAVQVRYQLTLGELALCAGDGEGALAALDALPEGWEEDAELAADAWLLWRQVHQAQGQTVKAREAEDQARAVAQARGFDLRLEEAGRDPVPAEPSLVPALLARIVGGRPPLR
jgi:tetratricopeptide (TPR) repeat protein